MPFLSRLFARGRSADLPPLPEVPFAAIGDVHGCDDLLSARLRQIAALAPGSVVVLLGDYIDRGPDSAAVLARLYGLAQAGHVVCLMGNHERMLLDFLAAPQESGPRWLRHGGLQTLHSFGLDCAPETMAGADLDDLARALADRLPPGLASWLAGLPLLWRSGPLWVVHAAANPRAPFEEQTERDLIWGNPDFFHRRRTDTVWVIHGHTIVSAPEIADGRIALDTGAFATGRLTGALFPTAGPLQILAE